MGGKDTKSGTAGRRRSGKWSRATLTAAVLAVVVAALAAFVDVPAARWFGANPGFPPKILYPVSDGVREYGQGFSVLIVALLIWTLDPKRRRQALLLVAAIIVTAVVTNLVKMATSRARPHEFLDSGRMWVFFEGFRHSRFNSFPSAHAASAFALSAALSVLYPRARWIFFPVAALCAAGRVSDLQHYVSDVVAGAAIGFWIGRTALTPWAGERLRHKR